MKLLQVKLPDDLMDKLDAERGPVSRRAWVVLKLCELLGVEFSEVQE